jgi:Type ISP C-terminal specificity domain
MDMPRRDLWMARIPNQIFVIEQHSHPISRGPGLIFSAVLSDFDHFNNRGGRALPFLHPDAMPNLAPGLLPGLSKRLGLDVATSDVLAYIAAITAHPAFTQTFTDELTTPGIRVPITADAGLWQQAVHIGRQVLWLHTYGAVFAGPDQPPNSVRYPSGDPRQPLSRAPVTSLPDDMSYDPERQAVVLGDGIFGPVSPSVWDYAVGGRNVINSWFNYRKNNPAGRRSSPLDAIHVETWDPDWTGEFIDLLTVLCRLVELEPAQAELLDRVLATALLAKDDLAADQVRWPATASDRKPRYSLNIQPNDGNETPTLL